MTVPAACRAVLFDLDGTLIDSYAAIAASINHVRAHYGLPPLPTDDVRQLVGHGLMVTIGRVVPGADAEEAAALYREHHPSVMFQMTRLLPGVAAELPVLKSRGLRLAVCSNKPVAFSKRLTAALKVAELFDQVLGPEDVPEPKPAPDMLWEGMRRMSVTTPESLYVGDMTVDIDTARAAGVRVWAVTTGSDSRATLERARPDALLDTLEGFAARVR
jgi:2-phosphoglycolate phosphatase